ncbi:DUF4148 domain-containing protein [Methylibium rhizosphaerae]|uniref:DUF4148 domain-containing protein n=1 Tax=Methylibium rhizosphaerae TaxID=2570323 RepID=UPI0011262AA0|nr:DUF4148 domain-containing protein [Methylibium rhizosphaerae]
MLRRYQRSMVMAAVLGALSAPVAFAAADNTETDQAPRTRAEVVSELEAARAMGWTPSMGEETGRLEVVAQPVAGQLTREEVKAEYLQAREEGLLDDSSSGPSPEVLARREAKNAQQYEEIVAANLQAEHERQAALDLQQQVAMAETVESGEMTYDEYLEVYAPAAGEPGLSSTTQVEPEPLPE